MPCTAIQGRVIDLLECLKILRALSGETRLKLVRLLSLHELCVCELEHILGLTQPAISQQVRVLKEAGLASSRREGNWIFYRVEPDDLKRALQAVSDCLQGGRRDERDGPMDNEWKRLAEILEEPPDNCPRTPRLM